MSRHQQAELAKVACWGPALRQSAFNLGSDCPLTQARIEAKVPLLQQRHSRPSTCSFGNMPLMS